MIRGGCLCGRIRFEIDRAVGPFELCHCSRCRKVSGSTVMAGLGVRREDFRWITGNSSHIRTYEAPLLASPPAYRVCFCANCGSPVPDPDASGAWLEIRAGLLDDDPILRPDKHIFVNLKSKWFTVTDRLPQLDEDALIAHRRRHVNP